MAKHYRGSMELYEQYAEHKINKSIWRQQMKKQRLENIKTLIADGKTQVEIAKILSLTGNNIRVIMHRYGLKALVKAPTGRQGKLAELTKKQQDDLATRIRMLKGEELLVSKSTELFSDTQLGAWCNGVKGLNQFCIDVLDVQLQDYQLDMATKMLEHKRFVGLTGRQTGKDFLISCFVIWMCVTNSNQKILLVSAAQR